MDVPIAPRPANSVLDLAKIEATGYVADDAGEKLLDYVRRETVKVGEQ
jgi:dTDP-4-dehydrorhamnose 3,5-epimerase